MKEAERVVHKNKLFVLIIRLDFSKDSVEFFTHDDFSHGKDA